MGAKTPTCLHSPGPELVSGCLVDSLSLYPTFHSRLEFLLCFCIQWFPLLSSNLGIDVIIFDVFYPTYICLEWDWGPISSVFRCQHKWGLDFSWSSNLPECCVWCSPWTELAWRNQSQYLKSQSPSQYDRSFGKTKENKAIFSLPWNI